MEERGCLAEERGCLPEGRGYLPKDCGYLSEYFRYCWFNLVICHTINSDLSVLPATPNGSACTPLGPILVLELMFHLLILQPYKRDTNQNAEPGWDTRWKADPGLPATRSILQGPEIHLLR